MAWRKEKRIGITEVVNKSGISAERLRYWELKGIIMPSRVNQGKKIVRRYSHEDIEIILEIRKMVDNDDFSLKGAAIRLNRPYKD